MTEVEKVREGAGALPSLEIDHTDRQTDAPASQTLARSFPCTRRRWPPSIAVGGSAKYAESGVSAGEEKDLGSGVRRRASPP
jgi:hypothetical protein